MYFKQPTKAKLLQLKLIHIFAREILPMKKLEIEKTKSTFIVSVLKVEYWLALVSSTFNFFINKIALANKWIRKIIPSRSNSALAYRTTVSKTGIESI
jgi:hypothetical protein